MTQENKELLLKDLCARLPYMPKIKIIYQQQGIEGTDEGNMSCDFIEKIVNDLHNGIITDMQIYLRPLSSMTDEEEKELNKKFDFYIQLPIWKGDCKIINLRPYGINQHLTTNVDNSVLSMLVDWLNKHHFDYRGLIEKGLALEAPKGMYNLKEK